LLRRHALAFIALAAAALVGGVAAARCPTDTPAGHGLLQFAGGPDATALDADAALGINPLFTWAELEPTEGVYNWEPLDESLAAAHATGRKVAPRVYTNAGDFEQATPDWVFDAGAAAYTLDAGASVVQPLPTDAVFTAKFEAFLATLGSRYDGHPDIEFFQTNAGMGAYGEMVWRLDTDAIDGFSRDEVVATIEHWIDRWRAAFPSTGLVLMQNFIGRDIAEDVTAHAVARGFYLQSNSTSQEDAAAAILRAHDGRTKIVLEIENNGCEDATGPAFDVLLDRVFSYGFAIDYLVVCGQTLEDAARASAAAERLRK
jgi:hypothetical protein